MNEDLILMIDRDGSKPRLFLQNGAKRGLTSWPSDVLAYMLTHSFGKGFDSHHLKFSPI